MFETKIESGRNVKTIKWFKERHYGCVHEYIHQDCLGDAKIIHQLTRQKTINSTIRELIRDLTAGAIAWEEVVAP